MCLEGIFKGLPCSIVGGLCHDGSSHSVTGPLASLGVSFKIGQCRRYFLVIGIECVFIHHKIVLEDVPEG